MSSQPTNGTVYEGWLVDDGGSGYMLSLGEFSKNGTLTYNDQMVNPYTYTQFIVTEEPFEDPDPRERLLQPEHSFRYLSDVNSIFFLDVIKINLMYGNIPWTLAKKKDRVLYGTTAWLGSGSGPNCSINDIMSTRFQRSMHLESRKKIQSYH